MGLKAYVADIWEAVVTTAKGMRITAAYGVNAKEEVTQPKIKISVAAGDRGVTVRLGALGTVEGQVLRDGAPLRGPFSVSRRRAPPPDETETSGYRGGLLAGDAITS